MVGSDAINCMRIQIDISGAKLGRWYEYAARFVIGGVVTALTGIIAKQYGPSVGGLFLAFPAIFPASATLIEKEERKKKEQRGLHGEKRGISAASADAAGSSAAALGLLVFGLVVWKLLPRHQTLSVLAVATLVWFAVAVLGWHIRKRI
jgi:hypothetical protein